MFQLIRNLNLKALGIAFVVSSFTIGIIFLGSRDLQYFDAALITYLFGTIFAIFGISYRYSVWLQRPPTWMYFKRGMQFFFSGKIFTHIWFVSKASIGNIAFQKFIYPRGKLKWLAHFFIAAGCLSAFAITIPLTFGWVHFTLMPETIDTYQAHFFGFSVFDFKLGSIVAFMTFHALNWSSYLIIIGCLYFLRRRFTNAGLIASQSFEGDLLPLLLLIIVSVTGLGLTYSYQFMKGFAFNFLAVTHAISVIIFLIWIPFGKFFHIIQRPAQIGAHIYKAEGEKQGMAICPHTVKEFSTQLHIDDLKAVTKELGFNFDNKDGSSHLDLSPEGKRSALAKAHLNARLESGSFFG
ncbi:MAG: MFS transporter [Ignavibacteria bacterium]